ncbi:hypothetical protein glysoja_016572 [Glycine soja]|nr:hypothetical protein glysoja_016572 [Glycine soja]
MISEPASSLRKREVQDRRLSIIDVSSADDSLLDGNPLSHQHSASKKVGMVSRKKPVATGRESSILKQSKVPVRSSLSSTLPSKRDSLGNLHVKSERDKAKQIVGDRVSSVAKASVLGGSRGSVPKPTLPSKSPVGPTVSTRTRSVTSTSSGNNLSDNIGKSSFSYLKRSYKPTSCCSVVKTPSRIASRNKAEPEISSLSSLMSATKLSSSISPASSISDWSSSESSSTTSMAKRVCNSSRSSIDSGSSRKVLLNTDTDQGTHPQTPLSDSSLLERQEAWHSGIISQKERTAPGAAVLPPASKKASGLRLPSPKIGFFDGVKPLVRTPRGSIVPGGLPKHGAESPREGQDKAELGKLQPSRSIVSIDNTNPNNQEAPHPNPFHGSLDVAIKTSNSVQNVKSSSDVSMGAVENTSHFHVVEEAHHDLPPLNGINNQENAHHDDQIDHLSKQVGHMDINFETGEKFNGDSLYLLHNDISSQDKSNGLELSSNKNDISSQDKSNGLELSSNKELIDCPKKDELFNGLSTTYLSVSPTSFDVAASTRTPFAVKDSFCNMDGVVFTESTVSEAKLTHLPVPESIIMKENE